MIRLLVFVSLFAALGCRASPRRFYQPNQANGGGATPTQPTTTSGHVSDDPRQALEEVDRDDAVQRVLGSRFRGTQSQHA